MKDLEPTLTPEQVDSLVDYCKTGGGPIGIVGEDGEVYWHLLPPGVANG